MVKSQSGRDFWPLGWTLHQWQEELASNSLRVTKHKSPLGICMYLWPIHIVGWQEPTQNCKAIFQLKNKRKLKKNSLVDLGFFMCFVWTQGPWDLGCGPVSTWERQPHAGYIQQIGLYDLHSHQCSWELHVHSWVWWGCLRRGELRAGRSCRTAGWTGFHWLILADRMLSGESRCCMKDRHGEQEMWDILRSISWKN